MDLSVLTSPIVEPVTVAEMRTFMGYPSSAQDTDIGYMITVAREWLEARTGFSCVSKSYKAYFEKDDAINGWYELPVVPVLAAPAITITVCGVSSTFEQKGMRRIYIRPAVTYSTIAIGAVVELYYIEATFQAGEVNQTANECIRRIVTSMFNHREDGIEINPGRLPYDTLKLIESLDHKTGF